MFGYLVANKPILNKEQVANYQSYYCSLCDSLYSNYGNIARTTLSFDLTFFALLLDGIKDSNSNTSSKNCPVHPFRKQTIIANEVIDYCADINLLLSYYKCIDDINDDNSLAAKNKEKKLRGFIETIKDKYPDKVESVVNHLQEISKLENDNCTNPDLPANAFGLLFSDLFIFDESLNIEALKGFGYHLGRFIYLMDAVMDLKDDLKSESYNPLVFIDSKNFHNMLMMVMEDVDYYYNQLNLHKNKDLTDNVLYSGLWSKYNIKFKRKEN